MADKFIPPVNHGQLCAVQLPSTGYVRLSQIVGNRQANPPIPAIFPVGRSSWWEGVRTGRYPKPHKLGPRTTAWHVDDVRALIDKLQSKEEA